MLRRRLPMDEGRRSPFPWQPCDSPATVHRSPSDSQLVLSRLPVGRRSLIAAAVFTLALVAVASMPQLLGAQVGKALSGLRSAQPLWLWVAAAAFVGALIVAAGAWRSALASCGAQLGLQEACARYGLGSLVNSLAPARLGDAVRIALFSRALENRERLWTTGGAFGAIGAARALSLGVLVVSASASGAMPLWPLLALGALVATAVLLALVARRRSPHRRVAHLLDAFRALGRSPMCAARLCGWVGLATVARVAGATAVAAALGVRAPLDAALIIVPALDLAGLLPLTPGNIGITSGAVAMALQSRGVGLTTALSSGIALNAVETAAGLAFGLASALFLASFPSPAARSWTMRLAGGGAALLIVAAFSATVLIDFV